MEAATSGLVSAYNDRVEELEQVNALLITTLQDAQSEIVALVEENRTARVECGQYKVQLHNAQARESILEGDLDEARRARARGRDTTETAALEEAASLRTECSSLREERSELSAVLSDRDAAIIALGAQNRALGSALAEAQAALRSLDGERQAALSEIVRVSDALGATSAALSASRQREAGSASDRDAARARSQALADALREVSDRAQAEAAALTEHVRGLNAQREGLVERAVAAEKEVSACMSLRAEVEVMKRGLNGMEARVEAAARQEETARAMQAAAGESLSRASRECSAAASRESLAMAEVERIRARRREEVEASARAQEAAVETVSKRLAAEVEVREGEIKSLRSQLASASLQMEVSLNAPGGCPVQDTGRVASEAAAAVDKVQLLQAALGAAERARDEARDEVFAVSVRVAASLAAAERGKAELQAKLAASEAMLAKQEASLVQEEAKRRASSSIAANMRSEAAFAVRELQEARTRHSTALAEERGVHAQEIAEARGKESLLSRQLQASQAHVESLQSNVASLQAEVDLRVARGLAPTLEAFEVAREEVALLRSRLTEVSVALQALQRDYMLALTAAQEAETSLAALRAAYVASQSAIADMSTQIAHASAREDDRLRELSEAKRAAEIARLAASRASARADASQSRLSSIERERSLGMHSLAVSGPLHLPRIGATMSTTVLPQIQYQAMHKQDGLGYGWGAGTMARRRGEAMAVATSNLKSPVRRGKVGDKDGNYAEKRLLGSSSSLRHENADRRGARTENAERGKEVEIDATPMNHCSSTFSNGMMHEGDTDEGLGNSGGLPATNVPAVVQGAAGPQSIGVSIESTTAASFHERSAREVAARTDVPDRVHAHVAEPAMRASVLEQQPHDLQREGERTAVPQLESLEVQEEFYTVSPEEEASPGEEGGRASQTEGTVRDREVDSGKHGEQKQEKDDEVLMAAVRVQAAARGHLTRMQLERQRGKIAVSRVVHNGIGHPDKNVHVAALDTHVAAVRIQSIARGRQARQQVTRPSEVPLPPPVPAVAVEGGVVLTAHVEAQKVMQVHNPARVTAPPPIDSASTGLLALVEREEECSADAGSMSSGSFDDDEEEEKPVDGEVAVVLPSHSPLAATESVAFEHDNIDQGAAAEAPSHRLVEQYAMEFGPIPTAAELHEGAGDLGAELGHGYNAPVEIEVLTAGAVKEVVDAITDSASNQIPLGALPVVLEVLSVAPCVGEVSETGEIAEDIEIEDLELY